MLNVDKKSEDGFQVLRDTDLSLKREKISVILILSVFVIVMWLISPKIATEGLLWAIIYGLLALSLNYQSGHSGITNFGVVGFFAIGAYVTSILSLMNWHWALALLFGMLISALFTFIISIPTLRLREDYFAIFTITFGEIIRLVFQAEEWFVYPPNPPDEKFYGGTKGLVVGNEIVRDISTYGKKTNNSDISYTLSHLFTLDSLEGYLLNIDSVGFVVEPSFSAVYKIALSYGTLIIVLLVRPYGLFGEKPSGDR
ncbi:MAG: hypothetical protein HeimC3_19030 [Candidatus Heimdallarchaeota archaeon LC_3]|nr:MAG: hypothetical protein HeimC3_19030 [Candidatus Heimdallarchaeota archaeon LC_3]